MKSSFSYRRWKTLLAAIFMSGMFTSSTHLAIAASSDSLVQHRLNRLIEQHFIEIYPKEQYRFEFEFKRMPRSLQGIEPDQLASVQKTSRGLPRGYETLKVQLVNGEGKSLGTTHVQIHLRLWQQLPVPEKRIRAGKRLSNRLFNYEWVEITRMTGNFLMDATRVEGYIADHMLPASRPIRETDLAKPSIVEAGDSVNMQFDDGGLQISLRCTARQAAAKGEEIRVFSEQTRRTYQVKVLNSNQVQWLQTL